MSGGHDVRRNDCGGNAAPYVLGALTDAESAAFVEHLSGCAVCREEVAALRTVAAALPGATPQFSAPPELKRRLFAQIDAEAQVPSEVGRARAGAAVRRRPLRLPSLQLPGLVPAGVGAALAAAVAIVLVLAVGGSGGGSPARVIRADVNAPGASATLEVKGTSAELRMAHMPQVQAGRVYEVWVKGSGAAIPTDALFTVNATGAATVAVPGGVRGVREVMVSSEPLGGSLAPTRSPVLVARVS